MYEIEAVDSECKEFRQREGDGFLFQVSNIVYEKYNFSSIITAFQLYASYMFVKLNFNTLLVQTRQVGMNRSLYSPNNQDYGEIKLE